MIPAWIIEETKKELEKAEEDNRPRLYIDEEPLEDGQTPPPETERTETYNFRSDHRSN